MVEGSVLNIKAADDEGKSPCAAVRGESHCDVLDVRGLCDRCMGNLDLVQRVLDKFESRLPEELAELERMLELEDDAKVALVAHRIKGSSSNVSADGLRRAAAEIEEMSRAGRVTEVRAHLPDLHEQWRRYVDCRGLLRAAIAGSARAAPDHPLETPIRTERRRENPDCRR